MAGRDRVLNFDDGFKSLDADLQETQNTAGHAKKVLEETEAELEQIKQELLAMPGVKLPVDGSNELSLMVEDLNHAMADIVLPSFRKTLPLTPMDVMAAIFSGIVASVIDIVFVFTCDRSYIANGKNRQETFYILFEHENTISSSSIYNVHASISQDFKNENSFIYKLCNLKDLVANRVGNLVVLKYESKDFNVDLLIDLNL